MARTRYCHCATCKTMMSGGAAARPRAWASCSAWAQLFRPASAYSLTRLKKLLPSNDLHAPIAEIAASLDFEDFAAVEKSTGVIREMIANAAIPRSLSDAIGERYQQLVTPDNCYVAVRSSVAVRDTGISSFPGMMDTYLTSGEWMRSSPRFCNAGRRCGLHAPLTCGITRASLTIRALLRRLCS